MNNKLLLSLFSVLLFASIVFPATLFAEEAPKNGRAQSQNSVPVSDQKKPVNDSTQPEPSAQQTQIDLETAYKREYAFLAAQKKELAERLKQYRFGIQGEEQALSNKINVLERDSVERSSKIDQLNILLAEAEREEAAAIERSDALEITYSQADATLKNHHITLPPSLMESQGNDSTKVGFIFDQALQLLRDLGSIQTTQSKFFLEDGQQTQGQIIRLGNIAAYGVSSEGSGSLVPAGGGDFKIWREPAADSAGALSKNQQPESLKLFLFESRTQAIDEAAEKSVLEVIHSGGVIGWFIVGLGVLTLLLVFIRIYLLRSNSLSTQQLSDQVIQQVVDGNLEAAKKSCEANSSAITRVLSNTLRHLRDDRDHMDSVVHEAILRESGVLDRFGSAIMVIASVSPLLGLLGTVTGMIATFDVITEFGTGDPKLLSGGISIALVTTKLGLIVAIPALLVGSVLSAWARNIKRDMEYAALRVTNAFLGRPESELQPQIQLRESNAPSTGTTMTPALSAPVG